MTHAFAGLLRHRLGPGVAVGLPRAGDSLLPGETSAIAAAIPARRAEFAAGRSAARAALRALGLPDTAIPMRPDRAPDWPSGIVGSITHAGPACLAIAARASTHLALGLDIEPAVPLDAALLPDITTDADRRLIAADPDPLLPLAMFCAREAVFKALFPIVKTVWPFDAMSIRPDRAAGRFAATLHRSAGPFTPGAVLHGDLLHHDDLIVAALALRA